MEVNIYKNYLKFEFNSTYDINQLPIYYNNKNGTSIIGAIKYKQLTNYKNNENFFKFFIEFTVEPEIVYLIIKELTNHTCISELYEKCNNILYINNYSNKIYEYIEKIILFDIFDTIKFGKHVSSIKNDFTKLKRTKNIKYLGNYSDNINMLPNDLDVIKYNYNYNKINILKKTDGTKKVILNEYNNKIQHSITHIYGYNKILLIDNQKIKYNLCEIEPDNILVITKNNYIDWTNLPWSIKKISLYDEFNETLEYLPNTIECIEFNGIINSNLYNLPSSISYVIFNDYDWNNFCEKINELNNNIELIYLDTCIKNIIEEPKIYLRLPEKLKSITINMSNSNFNYIIKIIEEYKEINNLNFNIIIK